jgi:hypothetical protein
MKIPMIVFFLFASLSAYADSCQIIKDQGVAEKALQILTENYASGDPIELMIGPVPSLDFKPYVIEIQNPRVAPLAISRGFVLAAGTLNGSGPVLLTWLDLGFTFYRDKATGKYLNLARAAGCKTFGSTFPEVEKP